MVASRSREWRYLDAEDLSPLAREFDPQPLWADFCRLIRGSLRDAGPSPGDVAVVTATSQRQGVVFLDGEGREVYAGPNLDLRAVFEGGAIDEQMRGRVYETTGHTPSFMLAPAKLRWFQLNRPDAYGRIATVLTLADWLVWRLSGNLVSEPTLAGEAGLLDIRRRQWCTGLLEELGLVLDNGHVPLMNAGSVAGCVSEEASRETGLPQGTPVAVSGADTQCGLLGMGVMRERQVGIVAGWSALLQMLSTRPVLAPSVKTWAGCFLTPDTWVLESTSGDTGNSYRWLVDTIGGSSQDAFSEMDKQADAVPAGSEAVMSFLGPSRMDMSRLGLRTGGFLFPVPMTFSDIGRGHLARAALESIAYAVNANLEQAESVGGGVATDIALGGGMIRTSTWVKVLVDVIGRPIMVSLDPHVSAVGAFLCASTAIGEFGSLEEAAGSISGKLRTVEPDPLLSSEYRDHYRKWVELGKQLEGLSL